MANDLTEATNPNAIYLLARIFEYDEPLSFSLTPLPSSPLPSPPILSSRLHSTPLTSLSLSTCSHLPEVNQGQKTKGHRLILKGSWRLQVNIWPWVNTNGIPFWGFGVNTPPILEPILVVGLNRMFTGGTTHIQSQDRLNPSGFSFWGEGTTPGFKSTLGWSKSRTLYWRLQVYIYIYIYIYNYIYIITYIYTYKTPRSCWMSSDSPEVDQGKNTKVLVGTFVRSDIPGADIDCEGARASLQFAQASSDADSSDSPKI